MTAIRSQHSRILQRLAAERRLLLMESMAGGHVTDYAAYRQLVGEIQGLDDALKLSEQADFELSGEEPDAGG